MIDTGTTAELAARARQGVCARPEHGHERGAALRAQGSGTPAHAQRPCRLRTRPGSGSGLGSGLGLGLGSGRGDATRGEARIGHAWSRGERWQMHSWSPDPPQGPACETLGTGQAAACGRVSPHRVALRPDPSRGDVSAPAPARPGVARTQSTWSMVDGRPSWVDAHCRDRWSLVRAPLSRCASLTPPSTLRYVARAQAVPCHPSSGRQMSSLPSVIRRPKQPTRDSQPTRALFFATSQHTHSTLCCNAP